MTNNAVCAVVVCYLPVEKELFQQFKATRHQVEHIVYVINESAGEAESLISLVSALPKIDIIRNSNNEGVAYALNQGIAHARRIGCDYVLFLDQDSIPYPDMVSQLLSAHDLIGSHSKIAAVGPVCIDSANNDYSYFVRFGHYKLKKIYCADTKGENHTVIPSDFLISSGSLSKTANFKAIGGMDNKLFIDHVDTEWFLRAKSVGYHAFGVCSAFMEHTLGDKRRTIWLGKWFRIAHHSPFRHYHLFRNGIIIMRRPYVRIRWKICEIRRLILIFLYFAFFSCENFKNLTEMVKGILDGISISSMEGSVTADSFYLEHE